MHDDLPLLIFLQGGPGGAGPRLNSPTSDGWIEEAIRHFRVILPDARHPFRRGDDVQQADALLIFTHGSSSLL